MDKLANILRQREIKERNAIYSPIYDKLFKEQMLEEFAASGVNIEENTDFDQLLRIWMETLLKKELTRVGWKAEWNYVLISYWQLSKGLENDIFTFEATKDHIYFGEFSTVEADFRIGRPDKVLKHIAQNDPDLQKHLVELVLEEEKTILVLSEQPTG